MAELANKPVYLQDVAKISLGYKDRLSAVSVREKKAVVVNIFKQPNANVVAVAAGVQNEFRRLLPTMQAGISVESAYNESSLVRSALSNVIEAIVIGIALIVLVLLLFLRSWKSTLIAALSIPLSALAAFVCLYLGGQSLNLMSLGGLAIAVGLVIDDAIVVIENISRQLATTSDVQVAIKKAVEELAGPVTSSTVTTVVVFLPLGLLSGVAGQFFTSLTVTLSAAVIFSWFLSTGPLMPLLAGALLRSRREKGRAQSPAQAIKDQETKDQQKTARANEETTKGQGEDEKGQGDDAKEQGEDAKQQGDDAKGQGGDAKEQGEDAKEQGEDAKEQGEDAKGQETELEKEISKTKTTGLYASCLKGLLYVPWIVLPIIAALIYARRAQFMQSFLPTFCPPLTRAVMCSTTWPRPVSPWLIWTPWQTNWKKLYRTPPRSSPGPGAAALSWDSSPPRLTKVTSWWC